MTNIGPGLGALGEVQIMILMGEAESILFWTNSVAPDVLASAFLDSFIR